MNLLSLRVAASAWSETSSSAWKPEEKKAEDATKQHNTSGLSHFDGDAQVKGESAITKEVSQEEESMPGTDDEEQFLDLQEKWDFINRERLSKGVIKRFETIKKEQKKRASKERRILRAKMRGTDRGDSEIRVCSLNTNGLGLSLDVGQILGARVKKAQGLRRRSYAQAIKKAACDVVALQGIVGLKRPNAEKGLQVLRKAVEKETARSWTALLGESRSVMSFVGFLVPADASFSVLEHKSYRDLVLPAVESFERVRFPVAPVELSLRVPGNGRKAARTVEVVNFQMSSFDLSDTVTIKDKLQQAEGIRRLFLGKRPSRNRKIFRDSPITVVVGETGYNHGDPLRRVLEGRLELADFDPTEGVCKIEIKEGGGEEIVCQGGFKNGAELIGLFSAQPIASKEKAPCQDPAKGKKCFRALSEKKIAGQRVRAFRGTSEIFVRPRELTYFREKQKYAASRPLLPSTCGTEKVTNGLKASPLRWVDINW